MKYFYLSVICFCFLSCTQEIRNGADEQYSDGKYDSDFPRNVSSNSIPDLMESIKLLSTIAFYESFEFLKDSNVVERELTRSVARKKSVSTRHYNQPATGTATLVYHESRKVALLTCAHVIDFPDSIIDFYLDAKGKKTKYVQKIAYKDRQNINIIDANLGGNFSVLAYDREQDIALVGKNLPLSAPPILPVFRYPIGYAAELDWGNFVYVIGYPRGEKMITYGIVSSPGRDKYNSFILNTVFNRGFSGGIIIAIRDGIPNFELVGMAKSVPAETDLFLKPNEGFRLSETNINYPYSGDILVDSHENIYYGITYAVSIESIGRFLEQNKLRFAELGYKLEYFFDNYSR